jgi:hypothetical protein
MDEVEEYVGLFFFEYYLLKFCLSIKGMSFDDRSTNINEEIIQENTPLIASTEQYYRRIRTTAFIVIHILFMVKRNLNSK